MNKKRLNKRWNIGIILISVLVPVIVSALFRKLPPAISPEFDLSIFPKFHAIINTTASILLILGFYFIRQH